MLEIWKLTVARKKKIYPPTTKPVSSVGGYQAFHCRDASMTHSPLKLSWLSALTLSAGQLQSTHVHTALHVLSFCHIGVALCFSLINPSQNSDILR